MNTDKKLKEAIDVLLQSDKLSNRKKKQLLKFKLGLQEAKTSEETQKTLEQFSHIIGVPMRIYGFFNMAIHIWDWLKQHLPHK